MLIRLLNKMLHAQNSPGPAHGSCGDSRLGCPAMAKPSGLGTLLRAVQTLFRGCRNSIITEGTYPQARPTFHAEPHRSALSSRVLRRDVIPGATHAPSRPHG